MKIASLLSTGKDSLFALFKAHKDNEIVCLITVQSNNPDSFMFHTPSVNFAGLQADALGLPLIKVKTKGIKEDELKDLKKVIKKAKEKFNIQGVVTGALFSEYQKSRIEKVCKDVGVVAISPLWHMNQFDEVKEIIDNNFKFVITKIACEGLSKDFLGKIIAEKELKKLAELNKKTAFNIAGEGGEYETFVLDMPLFKKKLVVEDSEIRVFDENSAEFIIKKARLESKV